MLRPTRLTRTLSAAAIAGLLILPAAPAPGGSPAHHPGQRTPTYTNPVSSSFADTYADPAVIQGKDGWWYAYATADPLRAGDPTKIGHIARTRDWVTWDYVGPIFDETNRPRWATAGSFLWAPDVRYIDGQYVMYFTATDTTLNADGWDPAIGVATSPTPYGPWTPTDSPIVAPRKSPDGRFFNTIDPAGFTDTDGNNYLYFGNYFGGTHVVKLDPSGLKATTGPTLVGAWDRYEGSYVVEHDGWYYYMASSADCCSGPATGYSVFVGRSRSPMGPFLDKDGLSMTASVTGGTLLVTQNGNRWIGPGHNAMFTDASGRDFLLYHAIDKNQPWLTSPFGINRRPMLADRIDWIGGWPVVNAGAGPSDTPMPAPVTRSLVTATPSAPADGLSRARSVADPQGGTSAQVKGNASTSRLPAGDVRVRLDLKKSKSTQVVLGSGRDQVKVTVDPSGGRLSLQARGRTVRDTVPRGIDGWQTLVVEVDRGRLTAYLSSSDLADPHAIVRTRVDHLDLRSAPLRIIGTGLVDNLTVARPAREARRPAPQPQPGRAIFRDDFTGALGSGWSWVRPQADVSLGATSLNWPLKSVDLAGAGGSGAVLLRDAPAGDWIAETKFTLDLGSESVRNYQQAGLVVYNGDDDFARLGSVAIWGTRTVEFGRELAASPAGGIKYGGAIVGANAPTMQMRIAHHQAANGEQLYRAGISRDGHEWIWGATWTFPAGSKPRIGLYAGGGATPAATASFDWFQLTSTRSMAGVWPS